MLILHRDAWNQWIVEAEKAEDVRDLLWKVFGNSLTRARLPENYPDIGTARSALVKYGERPGQYVVRFYLDASEKRSELADVSTPKARVVFAAAAPDRQSPPRKLPDPLDMTVAQLRTDAADALSVGRVSLVSGTLLALLALAVYATSALRAARRS